MSEFINPSRGVTINQKLDKLFPVACLACGAPYKRSDAKWMDGASRSICLKCGLDQHSSEAVLIRKATRVSG